MGMAWYSYASIRVERGERLNVGAVVLAREARYLEARLAGDAGWLQALAPEADLALIERPLQHFAAVCRGARQAAPLAGRPPSARCHWLTAPRSTIIQTSPVHVGSTTDPRATLEELLRTFVR